MSSSRRTSLAHTNRQTEWIRPTMEMEGIDNTRHQKNDEIISKSEPTRRRDISEITRRHLEKVISAMIPSSTCSASDPTENVHMNSPTTQTSQQDKQVIVNNYYIKDKMEGWKQVEAGEISPENSKGYIQSKPSEISPNDTTMEISTNPTSERTRESMSPTKTGTETKPHTEPNTRVIEDQQRFHVGNPEVQNMAPPMGGCYSLPPPTRTRGDVETAAMLECIRQLQLILKEHVLQNNKQAEYQMSQNVDLFSEMIKVQTRRDLDLAVMAIPTFTGEEPEKCLDWINRIRNVCSQAGHSLRQELINKSEPVVQNFIKTMGDTWTDEDVVDEILKYFSDIPTPAHAITKLRMLIQGEEEAIVTYNQKYKTLVESVEGKPKN